MGSLTGLKPSGKFFPGYIFLSLIVVAFCLLFLLPSPTSLESNEYSPVLKDKDGIPLSAVVSYPGEQWRFPLLGQLPQKYIKAVVAYEDKRFFYHLGVDPFAVLRALYINYREGKIVSGGSTITMQLARLLSKNRERSYSRKLYESLLALRIELTTSKKEILTLYANIVPMGGNIIGLSAASYFYFGNYTDNLTWAQAALLAVLPNEPGAIHLARKRADLRKKRNGLLKTLFDNGEMSENEYKLALTERIPKQRRKTPNVAKPLLFRQMSNYSLNGIKSVNPVFRTTLRGNLQRNVEVIAGRSLNLLKNEGVGNLSLIVVDNGSAEIVAYVGNSVAIENHRSSKYDDIADNPRGTGSTLKPFLFALMMDAGLLTPGMPVPDDGRGFHGFYSKNYENKYRGTVTAETALVLSLNLPFVYL